MAIQQQNSNIAAKLGARLSAANGACRGKAPELRPQRLPAGIKDGIAKLSSLYTKQQDADDGVCPKGEHFFRGSAIVMTPEEHNGQVCRGAITSIVVPLCDIAAKVYEGREKPAVPFLTNFNRFRSILQALSNCPDCMEDDKTDPTGAKTWAYWQAVMAALLNPQKPIYISFSTRGFTPKKTAQNPNPQEYVYEDWHGLASPEKANGQPFDPAAAVRVAPPSGGTTVSTLPADRQTTHNNNNPTTEHRQPTSSNNTSTYTGETADPAEVASLVEAVSSLGLDHPEGAAAAERLEDMAWANGWTKQQTESADWSGVGQMALSPPTAAGTTNSGPGTNDVPAVGSKWLFARRTREGARFKDNKGMEFPPVDVEVVSVDITAKTATVKTKDGREVQDMRTKQALPVKWEWLDRVPPY